MAGASLGSGSHGSSTRDGTMCDLVTEISLVLPDGSIVTLRDEEEDDDRNPITLRDEEEEDDDRNPRPSPGAVPGATPRLSLRLRDVRLSLGLLGIATAIRLRCVRQYYVRRTVHAMDVAEFGNRAEALADCFRHL
jgi:FAD/FMN-containing dehydrogenase